MSKNLRGLSARKGLNQNLFREITKVGSDHSENRNDRLKELSADYLLGKGSILGTSSFYDFLHKDYAEKQVFVCDGTACLTSGKQEKLREALSESYTSEEIGSVTCLGHCHSNNAYLLNHATWSAGDLGRAVKTGNKINNYPQPVYTESNALNPVLISLTGNLRDYYGIISRYNDNIPGILNEIELSGLRGRGGAGFPFHIKLRSTAGAISEQKYVVCNADEGDPGAFSDKWLLEERPHSVLFGMMVAGLVAGADTGVIYVRGEYPEAVRSVSAAVDEFEKMFESGIKTGDSSRLFNFRVIEGAGAYICGEETSLLNSIEGLRPEVRTRPPFPAEYGLFGKPTLLSNVETFANLRYILCEGGKAWAAPGTAKSPGTKLVSLDGAFVRPGVYEIKMGTPLTEVFNMMGMGTRYPVKAWQVGGPLGGIVPASEVGSLTLDFESFTKAGFLMGHAGVVSVPADFQMIKFLLHLFEFTAKESCGKCFPCRIGSARGAELLKRAVDGREKIDKELFSDLLETMKLGSLCALGGGLPLPVTNALHYFSSELKEYFTLPKVE
jgi:NADH:ubiquinone oxidoreductase subunit F (NADH-binding)